MRPAYPLQIQPGHGETHHGREWHSIPYGRPWCRNLWTSLPQNDSSEAVSSGPRSVGPRCPHTEHLAQLSSKANCAGSRLYCYQVSGGPKWNSKVHIGTQETLSTANHNLTESGSKGLCGMVDYRWATPVCAGKWLTKLVWLLGTWEDTEKWLQGTAGQNYDMSLGNATSINTATVFLTVIIFGC